MARTRNGQSKHNAKVHSIARKLANQGYKVKADIKGYSKPDTIRGFRPDVIGTKGKERKIHEVETPDSINSARDKEQGKAFKQVSKQSENTTFKRTVTK